MSKIRIKSITEKKGSRVAIKYLLDGDPQSYSTSNNVAKEFTHCLDALLPDIVRALELESPHEGDEFDYTERLRVEEVKLTYKTNNDSESVTCQFAVRKELALGDNIKIETPTRHLEREKEGAVWSTETREKVNALCNKAIAEIKSDARLRAIYQQSELSLQDEAA